jgi:protein associated with RNAse G/E
MFAIKMQYGLLDVEGGHVITVVKLDPLGNEKIRYKGKVIMRSPASVVIEAKWTLPARDLGYARFEPGDLFTEYYYVDRWFNIFDIKNATGARKGWYCNIAEPAMIYEDQIKQVDLLLDLWVNPTGETLLLDEDEFMQDTTLNDQQRNGARQGLQALLTMLASRQETFADLANV